MDATRLQRIEEALRPFMPEGTSASAAELVVRYRCHVTITHDRKSKLGDYRAPHGAKGHRVTVNGSLNRYAFFITFIHEMAHLTAFERFGRDKLPHGKEWKDEFRALMLPYLEGNLLPEPLRTALRKHMRNPKSSTTGDPELMRILRTFDPPKKTVHVSDIPTGVAFRLNGKVFVKGEQLRKRFRCTERASGRIFLVSPIAEAVPVKEESP